MVVNQSVDRQRTNISDAHLFRFIQQHSPNAYRRTMRPSSSVPATGALLLSLLGLAALLLQRVGAGWVDPDTPASAQTARSYKEGK